MITLAQAVRLLGLSNDDGAYLVLQPGCNMMNCVYMSLRDMRHRLDMREIRVTHINPNHFKYTWEPNTCWEFTITTGTASGTEALLRSLHNKDF